MYYTEVCAQVDAPAALTTGMDPLSPYSQNKRMGKPHRWCGR